MPSISLLFLLSLRILRELLFFLKLGSGCMLRVSTSSLGKIVWDFTEFAFTSMKVGWVDLLVAAESIFQAHMAPCGCCCMRWIYCGMGTSAMLS